jgi:hypothetical protein
MSATTRPISFLTRDAAPDPALALTIRWEISPRALLASAPAAALLNGEAPRLVSAALLWHIDHASARAELSLELTRSERHSIPLTGPIAATIARDSESIHIDADGALHLSLRPTQGDPAILYARTPLLAAALALPGGVYDAPSIARPR